MKSIEREIEKEPKENYYDIKAVSSTSLGWFERSPKLYKRLTDGEREKTISSYMKLGTAIHSAILTPEKFRENYIRVRDKITGKMGIYVEAFVDVLVSGVSEEAAHEIAYMKAEYKLPPETVMKSFDTEEIKSYVRFLYNNAGKTFLNEEEWKTVETCKESVLKHKEVSRIFDTSNLELESYTEQEIYWKEPESSLDLKSKIDRIVVDNDKQVIYLIDIKSTSKDVHIHNRTPAFISAIKQLSFYRDAVGQWFWKLHNMDAFIDYKLPNRNKVGYSIIPYIITVQTTEDFETVIYQIDNEILDIAKEGGIINSPSSELFSKIRGFMDILKDIEWHKKNNLWEYPRYYYDNDGIVRCNARENRIKGRK